MHSLNERFIKPTIVKLQVILRYFALRKQLAEIQRHIDQLSLADRRALYTHVRRELDSSNTQQREPTYLQTCLLRARASNPKVRLVGISQWLVGVFQETEGNEASELHDLHRNVMRVIRQLKELSEPAARVA